jgi:DNA polymerase III alpha subunit
VKTLKLRDGSRVTVGGLVTTVKKMVNKEGRTWAAFTVEDLTGSIEVLGFAKDLRKLRRVRRRRRQADD